MQTLFPSATPPFMVRVIGLDAATPEVGEVMVKLPNEPGKKASGGEGVGEGAGDGITNGESEAVGVGAAVGKESSLEEAV